MSKITTHGIASALTAPVVRCYRFSLADLMNLFSDDADMLERIDRATQAPHGVHHPKPDDDVDNVNIISRPDGNAKAQALRRLRKDRPDLLERVLSGELSAHGAAIEAGFRKRMMAIEPTPEAVERFVQKHLPEYDMSLQKR